MTGKEAGEAAVKFGNYMIKHMPNERLSAEQEEAFGIFQMINIVFAGAEAEEAKSREVK